MNYDLKSPCKHCPFRSDIKPFIAAERARDILSGNEFQCHKTVAWVEDDDGNEVQADKSKPQHCAGVLILLEKEERPHQMMRIAERIGLYDHKLLDMKAPVYDSISDCLRAHRKSGARP